MSDKLRRSVEAALQELRGSVAALGELLDRIDQGHAPNDIELYALAYMLETFYTWVENVLKCIARGLDETLPDGEAWHRKFLQQMSHPTDHRPAVITAPLYEPLSQLRSFRHRSRNISMQFIAWPPIRNLVTNCRDLLDCFEEAVVDFLKQIEVEDA